MKIACIINNITVSGGAERVMCELANGLSERGHEVHLITSDVPRGENYFVNDKVILKNTAVKCKVPGIRNLVRNTALHKILKQNRYDVAVSFMTDMNVQAIMASSDTGVPVVVSERIDPRVLKGSLVGFLRSVIYPSSEGFVFQTDDARSFFSKKIQDRSSVIPNPILNAMPEKTDYEKTGRIVTVGRLTKQKNYPLMLNAFAEFHKSHPDYSLEIYGKGGLLDELKALAVSLKIANSVQFMGQHSDVHDCIKDADLFIMTSDYEGMSNALAEVMVSGLSCISTDGSGGGASFLIQDKVSGILTQCGDREGLVAALNELANNQEMRQHMGNEAKKLSEKLSSKNIFTAWEEYLIKVASANKKD